VKYFSVFAVSLLFVPSLAFANSLEDCLLEKLDGVKSDVAAQAIINACEKKFSGTEDSSPSDDNASLQNTLTGEIVVELAGSIFSSEKPVYRIPVPEGDWKKVGDSKTYRENPPIHYEVWIDAKGPELRHMLFLTYTKSDHQYGWQPSSQCERTNLHFIEKIENRDGGNQNCYGVNHYRISGGSDKIEAVKEAKDYARENGIAFPSTVLTHFHRLTTGKLFDFWIGYNPELEGFPAPVDSSWSSNDWHQDRIIGDSKRQEYIAKIKSLAEITHKQMESQVDF
jgi:hypothetical protein